MTSAGKHLDAVMGIDTHIVLVPTPVGALVPTPPHALAAIEYAACNVIVQRHDEHWHMYERASHSKTYGVASSSVRGGSSVTTAHRGRATPGILP